MVLHRGLLKGYIGFGVQGLVQDIGLYRGIQGFYRDYVKPGYLGVIHVYVYIYIWGISCGRLEASKIKLPMF